MMNSTMIREAIFTGRWAMSPWYWVKLEKVYHYISSVRSTRLGHFLLLPSTSPRCRTGLTHGLVARDHSKFRQGSLNMVTRCYFCGGSTALKTVTAENWWGDELALIKDVPAWVCENCGECFFDASTSEKLEHLRESPPSTQETIEVPVYAFADRNS